MCNLYSITTNQEAIGARFRVVNRYVGNLRSQCQTYPHPRRPVARPRIDPQRIDNLHGRQTLRFHAGMGTKSRETIYGSSVRASAERATGARKVAQFGCSLPLRSTAANAHITLSSGISPQSRGVQDVPTLGVLP
jgi:hypothetical protein